jgi:ABC-2 type transport system permease protein
MNKSKGHKKFNITQFMKTINEVRNFAGNPKHMGIFLSAAFAFLLFFVSTSGVTATAISREGQNLFVCKYLPVSYKDQIMAKVFSGVAVSLIGLLTIIIVAAAVLQISPAALMILFLAGLLGILFTSFTGILIDLLNPKLNWDNEQKAVKQNLNLMFNMLIGIAFGGLVVLAEVKFKFKYELFSSLLIIVTLLLDIILYKFILTRGDRLFERLEDEV